MFKIRNSQSEKKLNDPKFQTNNRPDSRVMTSYRQDFGVVYTASHPNTSDVWSFGGHGSSCPSGYATGIVML